MSTDLIEATGTALDQPLSVSETRLIVTKMLAAIGKAETKLEDARIELGRWLLKLRKQIDDGEDGDGALDWWSWYAKYIPHHRSFAEKYMRIAADKNPSLAYQKEKDRNAERVRAFRARQTQLTAPHETPVLRNTEAEPELLTPAPKPQRRFPSAEGDDALLEYLENVFRQLSWDGRVRGMKRLNKLYNDWRAGKQ